MKNSEIITGYNKLKELISLYSMKYIVKYDYNINKHVITKNINIKISDIEGIIITDSGFDVIVLSDDNKDYITIKFKINIDDFTEGYVQNINKLKLKSSEEYLIAVTNQHNEKEELKLNQFKQFQFNLKQINLKEIDNKLEFIFTDNDVKLLIPEYDIILYECQLNYKIHKLKSKTNNKLKDIIKQYFINNNYSHLII